MLWRMDDLVAFMSARLDEDRAVAREAAGLTECWVAEEPAIGVVLVDGEPLIEGHIAGLTAHIARHDPARVLHEVAAKRAIIRWHGGLDADYDYGTFPDDIIAALAAVYSDHPDYREEWAPVV